MRLYLARYFLISGTLSFESSISLGWLAQMIDPRSSVICLWYMSLYSVGILDGSMGSHKLTINF
eukprot:gene1461-12585_t